MKAGSVSLYVTSASVDLVTLVGGSQGVETVKANVVDLPNKTTPYLSFAVTTMLKAPATIE